MSLSERLEMKSQERRRRENVAEIKQRIRNSDQTVRVLDRVVKCVDANTCRGYRWTGSGLVFYAGKVIERIDWSERSG